MTARRSAGFTLVEAMITVAVIAVVAGISAPNLLNSLPGLRANGGARQVLSDLRLARARAVDSGQPVVFEFLAGGDYRLFVDVDGDGSYGAGTDTLVKAVDIDGTNYYKGVAFGSARSTGDEVGPAPSPTTALTFRPNGSVSTGGSVYLNTGAADDRQRRVRVVAATGNTRAERWEGSSWQ